MSKEVIDKRKVWDLHAGDNLAWLQSLPDGCCSLTITSPPYESARTYGLGFKLIGQEWVDWMIPRVVEMARVTNGLVCINMAGQVRDASYSPVVEWLVADLTRHHGLVCGPSPYVFFRFGIPGSGSRHYHRRDWEPVYCFARPENLPLKWSDNTATGTTPKYAPGGAMSHRLKDGARVSKFGSGGRTGMGRSKSGHHVLPSNSSIRETVTVGGEKPNLFGDEIPSETHERIEKAIQSSSDGEVVLSDTRNFKQVAIANSGNVIKEKYDAETVRQLIEDLATRKIEPGDVIRCLVGGGAMGNKKAHANEAPFPETLVEFFIRSFCPPDGIVCDPHLGSGTSGAVAVRLGRRFLGCDIRESQVKLSRERIAGETPSLFG